ncbi:hypothetical protein ACFWUP_21790 [Nocardia sp. NPDC058658]|uniref:hypothetical protein n=1 Tax=Nocardia sp. NPDC058658 TaxID=3346580 RepID=UPI0036580A09
MHDEFFARVVHDRRTTLGLTMLEVRERGGPAVPTQVEAERGALRTNVKPSTFAKFDAGLGWMPGSAVAAYREGHQPATIAQQPPSRTLEPGANAVAIELEQILGLLDAQRELHISLTSTLDRAIPEAVGRLDQAVSAIVGPFVTDILERNRDQHTHPLIEIAFAEALAAPVSTDAPESTERLYRRWLIGRADTLDEATRQQFERRYEDRIRTP